MRDRRNTILLTGATGLLGRSLLRDLAAEGRQLAVLVRRSRSVDAATRVDQLLADWQQIAGETVPCPVVLEGDIADERLGLSTEAFEWVTAHVGEVIHSAASLAFDRRDTDGEPYTSNVEGTSHVLEVCRQAGIRRLHHVSSAYVCGLRQGVVREDELDVGQASGNDYERSKILSETAVRQADFLEACTVYRPSVIVGDLVHGFTNTFHGFYRPLRIVTPFLAEFYKAGVTGDALVEVLGLDGSERKNLVPVDWVSAVMTRIIQSPRLHGRTYHLTTDHPTPVSLLRRVYEELALERAARLPEGSSAASFFGDDVGSSGLELLFNEQMQVYRSYWRDDPTFDAAQTLRAVPDLPSPRLDEEALRRLCSFALDHNFRWVSASRRRVITPRSLLEQALGPADWHADPLEMTGGSVTSIGLAADGPGGGQWTFRFDREGTPAWSVGLMPGRPTVRLSATLLGDVLDGRHAVGDLHERGELLVEGTLDAEPVVSSLRTVLEACRKDGTSSTRGRTAAATTA